MGLLDLGPSCFVSEEWGSLDPLARTAIDLVPLAPSPDGGTPVVGVNGPTSAAGSQESLSGGQAFYSEGQRTAIANQALADGAKGGMATAGVGVGMDVLGLVGGKGASALIKAGTTTGKIAGAAAGTAVPILGGVMAGVNLYNTISNWDTNFSQPWGTLTNSEAPGMERLASGLDLLGTVLGVLSDVLGIVAAVLAVASVLTAIIGVGFALGAVTGAVTVASLATAALSLVVSGVAAGIRYYQIIEGKGDPTEVAAQAEKLKAHTANALGQAGGLASAGGQHHMESRAQVKTGQSHVDNSVDPGIVGVGDGLTAAPPPPTNAVQLTPPSDVGSIGTGIKAGETPINPVSTTPVVPQTSTDLPLGVAVDVTPQLTAQLPKPTVQGGTDTPKIIIPGQENTGGSGKLILPGQQGGSETPTILMPGPNELRQFGGQKGNLEAHGPGSLITSVDPELHAHLGNTDVRNDVVKSDLLKGGRNDAEIPKGSGADHLKKAGWTDGEIARFQELTVKDPTTMSPLEIGQLSEGRAILHETMKPGAEMSKVLSPGTDTPYQLQSNADGSTKGKLGGFVAKAETTAGMDAPETIDALALNYQDKNGDMPYLPDGKPVDEVYTSTFKLTEGQSKDLAMPTHPSLQGQFEGRGIKTKAQSNQGVTDPFTGTGGPGSKTVGNEYVLNRTEHAVGDKVSKRGPTGDQELGTMQAILGADGKPINDKRFLQPTPQPGQLLGVDGMPLQSGGGASPKTSVVGSTDSAPVTTPGTGSGDSSPQVGTANQIATTTGLLQGMMTPELELPEPERVFPEVSSLGSVSGSSAATPVYDYGSAEALAPPVSEVVGLEELPAAPHDPRVVASHAPVVAGLEAREQLMLGQIQLQDGVLDSYDEVLGSEGPFAAMEQDQANREATLAEQISHSASVDAGIGLAEDRNEQVAKDKAKSEQEQGKLEGSGAGDDVMGMVSNPAVKGLVLVGGGIAKAGAAVINGIGSLFGAEEPVIDTSTIDKLMELFSAGPKLKQSQGQVSGKGGATSDAASGMEASVVERRGELETVEKDNQQVEGEGKKVQGTVSQGRKTAEQEAKGQAAERQASLSHLAGVQGAKGRAAQVYDAELTALSAWQADYAATVARNEERIAAAQAAAAAPVLTGDQQAQVDARLSRVDSLQALRDGVGGELAAYGDAQRAAGESANGVAFPGSYRALADAAIAGFGTRFDAVVSPVLEQIRVDLSGVSPDRVHSACMAADLAMDQIVTFVQAERDAAASTVRAVYIRLDRSPETQRAEVLARLPVQD